jgi:hypothetical protein
MIAERMTVADIARRFTRVRGWTPWYLLYGERSAVRVYVVNGKAIRTQFKQ